MKLSIIIPYYNLAEYTDELLKALDAQMTDDVEVWLIDDCSDKVYKPDYEWLRVYRFKKNKGVSAARNKGLDLATGQYIQFIDADDMIPPYFIKRLLEEIERLEFDVCDYSWKSMSGGAQYDMKLQNKDSRLKNPSTCTRAFRSAYIGDLRFNINKDSSEDEEFCRKLGFLDAKSGAKRTAIPEYMYFYRTMVSDSKIKKFKDGILNTKRILYYFEHLTPNEALLEEIKHEDELNEVVVMTKQNDFPELSYHCQIMSPFPTWAHELRGERFTSCDIIEPPMRFQVILFSGLIEKVSGISTFIYNFCRIMKKYYDIAVVYENGDPEQLARLSEMVYVAKNNQSLNIYCETMILNRLTDGIPQNIRFKRSIQMCHACQLPRYQIPQDRDIIINVSEVSKASWGDSSKDGIVIHNMLAHDTYKTLLLVSATRIGSIDKGGNDKRMKQLAEKLEQSEISYIWLNFSDVPLRDMPESFINMSPRIDVRPYISKADYLVQLSDREAYSYSIVEALSNSTAVITTPMDILDELQFVDGYHGHIIPYDMDFDIKKLLDVPQFLYVHDVIESVDKWKKILGNSKPTHHYKPQGSVQIVCTTEYTDTVLKRFIPVGEHLTVTEGRAQAIINAGFAKRVRAV